MAVQLLTGFSSVTHLPSCLHPYAGLLAFEPIYLHCYTSWLLMFASRSLWLLQFNLCSEGVAAAITLEDIAHVRNHCCDEKNIKNLSWIQMGDTSSVNYDADTAIHAFPRGGSP